MAGASANVKAKATATAKVKTAVEKPPAAAAASKRTDAEGAFAKLVAAIEAIAHIHASVPSSLTEIQELLQGTHTLQSRIEEYASADWSKSKGKGREKRDKDKERRDRLDREGVMLWNRSTALKQNRLVVAHRNTEDESEDPNRAKFEQLVAMVRFVAARLVDLGSDRPHSHADLVRLLELYTKAVLELTGAIDYPNALKATEHAAEYEEQLNGTLASAPTEPGARKHASKAVLQYYQARSKLAWLENNPGPAKHFFQKACTELLLSDCTPREIERLASQAYEFGAALLKGESATSGIARGVRPKGQVYAQSKQQKTEGNSRDEELEKKEKKTRAEDALVWFGLALKLVLREGCFGDPSGQAKRTETQRRFFSIQVSTLKAIAQAHLDIASADKNTSTAKAETAIDEVLKLETSPKLLRAKLRLLIKRNAGESDISTTVGECLKIMDCTQESVTVLIREIHELPKSRKHLVQRLLGNMYIALCTDRAEDGGASWAYMPLLSFCYGLSSSAADCASLKSLLDSTASIQDPLILAAEASFACQGMLWKQGDQALKAEKHALAADWYLLSTHATFSALSESNFPKARRKASLALLYAQEHARAEEVIRSPGSGISAASDHYVLFLCATLQGDEQKAIRAIKAMIGASDFKMDMLYWAAKQAKEVDLNDAFKFCLQSILRVASKAHLGAGQGIDSLTVLRCLVKTALEEYAKADGEAEQSAALDVVQEQLQLADQLLGHPPDTGRATDSAAQDRRDATAWLYKSALNFILGGLKTWPLQRTAGLARCTAKLAAHYAALCDTGGEDARTALKNELTLAYLAVASEMQHLQLGDKTSGRQTKEHARLLAETAALLQRLHTANLNLAPELVENLKTSCTALHFELLLKLQNWEDAKILLGGATAPPVSLALLQKLADLTCGCNACPADVAVIAIEAVMNAAAREQGMDARRISKFVRAIIASCLDKEDNEGAFRYYQSAASLIQDSTDYPRAEIEWLLTTAWNLGLEVFPACPEDGSAWCEQALALAQHMSGYADMREAMIAYYRQLHERYGLDQLYEDDSLV